LVVAAAPQPQFQVVFHWNGKSYSLIIPPTYPYYSDRQVEKILKKCLGPYGYHVLKAILPLKLLAVRSGLGMYGKNNICYVPQMGSFHRLVAFYTDLPCPEDTWQEVEMLEDCHDCLACLRGCPTGAISSDRFLLRAERCITFHNEREGDFPGWIHPSWHNALVGCLHCQKVCPPNRPFLRWVEYRGDFSEKETSLLLSAKSLDRLPSAVATKLRHLDLVEYLDVLARNLRVLLEKKKGS
jgi:epoxyqueuosine reductase